jgi:folate-binding protein YgfZ
MSDTRALALLDGVYADCSSWRKVAVSGTEALQWLNDLVSADLNRLAAGEGRRSLLLGPTGKVRASFQAIRLAGDSALLVQDPTEPSPIDQLLAPYVLSSDVALEDRTEALALFAFPAAQAPLEVPAGTWIRGSCLGDGGFDLLVDAADRAAVLEALPGGIQAAGREALEAWRVTSGFPQVGRDATADDLPMEAGLQDAVAFDKGCYLGQEAMARVRNLGHPRRVLVRVETDAQVSAGDPIFVDGEQAGAVTSAVMVNGRTVALASVRWAHRDGPLRTKEGAELSARPLP